MKQKKSIKNNSYKKVRLKLRLGEILIYSLMIPFMLLAFIVLILSAAQVIKNDIHLSILILGMIAPVYLIILSILKFTNSWYIFKEDFLLQIDALVTFKIEYSKIEAIIEDKEKNRIFLKYKKTKDETAVVWMRIDSKNITNVIGWLIEKCESLSIEEVDKVEKQ